MFPKRVICDNGSVIFIYKWKNYYYPSSSIFRIASPSLAFLYSQEDLKVGYETGKMPSSSEWFDKFMEGLKDGGINVRKMEVQAENSIERNN